MLLDAARIRRCLAVTAFCLAVAAPALTSADIDKTSSGNGYEVWDVSGMEIYDLSDGETLSNILVDQTGSGNTLTIRSRNKSNWTVKNIGFKGVGTDGDGGNSFQLQISAPSNGSGLVENVWMNNKTRNGEKADVLGGIYIRSSHAGHIDIRHTWIEGFGNNAVYGSAVGKDGGNEGTITIENAYHRDNTVSQFRIGSPGSVVRNSVAVVNDPEGLRGSYPSSDSKNARGIWGKHFPGVRVENSSFYMSSNDVNADSAFEARYISDRSHGEEAVLEVVDCDLNADAPAVKDATNNARVEITNLGNSPSVDVIKGGGVPTSAPMAARGNREMPPELSGAEDDGDEYPHTLQIDGRDADRTDYTFTVDGELTAHDPLGGIGTGDSISGSSAEGFVNGGTDGYAFSGSITAFQLEGNATVNVDGQTWDPSTCCNNGGNSDDVGTDAGVASDTGADNADAGGTPGDDTGRADTVDSPDTEGDLGTGAGRDAGEDEDIVAEGSTGCQMAPSGPGGLLSLLLFVLAAVPVRVRRPS